MRSLKCSTSLALLLTACSGGGNDDTGSTTATTGGPTGDPGTDGSATDSPTSPDTPTSVASDPSMASATEPTTTNPSDPTATDPTATTDPTGPDPGELIEPGDPGPGDVTFTIRADQDVHPIDPRIYGTNQPHDLDTLQRGIGLVRQGGNRMTAYNWENNASNAGADYMHQNDGYLESQLMVDGDIPGEVVRKATQDALDAGADMMVTIPICGYVAADKHGNG
ncbi:MAG TPA: hypothetical protein VGB85_07535, partial [Nannocystis sp.]